jgi:alkylation response protein AidB-like acyl-CoA dehydrogenase
MCGQLLAGAIDDADMGELLEADSAGLTVENRNALMGVRGIENGVTRFHDVRVPAENMTGKEGRGLAIALTTLKAGRLSLPALSAATGKWALKIAREWSTARVQWGKPIYQHEAIAAKIGFIAATAFRARGDRRPVQPDGQRGPQRHPHRGRAGQALRLGDGLADRGRAGADPRRPWVRVGRLVARPR